MSRVKQLIKRFELNSIHIRDDDVKNEIETNYQSFVNESKKDIDVIIQDVTISDIDNVIEVNINPIKNKKKGRPPALNKTTKDGRPTDPDYFKKYYTEKVKKRVGPCNFCQCNVILNQLPKHQRTKKCHQIRKLLEEKNNELNN
jgi:hypothetical protein